jgi:hypothetical protein
VPPSKAVGRNSYQLWNKNVPNGTNFVPALIEALGNCTPSYL